MSIRWISGGFTEVWFYGHNNSVFLPNQTNKKKKQSNLSWTILNIFLSLILFLLVTFFINTEKWLTKCFLYSSDDLKMCFNWNNDKRSSHLCFDTSQGGHFFTLVLWYLPGRSLMSTDAITKLNIIILLGQPQFPIFHMP